MIPEEILHQIKSKAESILENEAVIFFKITAPRQGGFYIQSIGLKGFINFEYMPWEYPNDSYWKNVVPFLINYSFKGRIKHIFQSPVNLLINAKLKQFSSALLLRGELYKCIVLYKSKFSLTVEIGLAFEWRYGSVIGEVFAASFKQDNYKEIAVGEVLSLYYLRKNKFNNPVLSVYPNDSSCIADNIGHSTLSILTKRVSLLKQIQNINEFVSFEPYEITEKGIIGKSMGIFAFIPFSYMPWRYYQLSHWNIIFNYLKSSTFKAAIIHINYKILSLKLDARNIKFESISLLKDQSYKAIILEINKDFYILDLALHFNWKYGKKIVYLKSYLVENKLRDLLKKGDIISVIYFGINENAEVLIGKTINQKNLILGQIPSLIKKQFPFLDHLKQKILKKFIYRESVEFKIIGMEDDGMLIESMGILGKVNFTDFAWKYPQRSYWEIIFPFLEGVYFEAEIQKLDDFRIFFYLKMNKTLKTSDISNGYFEAIIIHEHNNVFELELGQFFNWEKGSIILKYELKGNKDELDKYFVIGQKISIEVRNDVIRPISFEKDIYLDDRYSNTENFELKSSKLDLVWIDAIYETSFSSINYVMNTKYLTFYENMPWVYEKLYYWQVISRTLKSTFYKFSILDSDKGLVKLKLDNKDSVLDKLVLNWGYKAIILDKFSDKLILDIGIHFNWTFGSFTFSLPKYHFSKKKYHNINVGEIIRVLYWGKPVDRAIHIFGYNEAFYHVDTINMDEWIGRQVKVNVTKLGNKRKFSVENKFAADIIASKDEFPKSFHKIKYYKNRLQDRATIDAKIVSFDYANMRFKVKWIAYSE